MRIVAYQPPATADVAEAVERLRDALAKADAEGIDLVCFPECYIGGYFPNDRAATERAAYEVGSATLERILRQIGVFKATLVVGIAERRGAQLFNTALVITGGAVVGTYAKARPNEAFFTPGSAFPTFSIAESSFGINICNDANHPDVARTVADSGAHGIVMPLNNLLRHEVAEAWRERHLANLVARARETGCWVVSSDIVGVTAERVAYGTTAIVGTDGRVLARVPEGVDGFVWQDVP